MIEFLSLSISHWQLACLLFALAITAHNIEEFVWLPAWSQDAGKWSKAFAELAFKKMIIGLTLLVYALLIAAASLPQASWLIYPLAGYAGAMALNSFHPHLFASIAQKRYSPGLATGLLLNLPAGCWLIYVALGISLIEVNALIISIVLCAVTLLLLIPRAVTALDRQA